jgi:thiol-disulfide isomerase/thioredoxin
MKRITILLLAVTLLSTGCSTSMTAKTNIAPKAPVAQSVTSEPAVNYSDQSTWILGYFNPALLKREPHSVWFYKGFDEYNPDEKALSELKSIGTGGITIKVVMGTWCPDSRREVPRFMKILDSWQFPAGNVTFIGVDNAKISPVGEYDKLEIHRVPTFIIYQNNIESGRIIENPVTSLEQDMVNILRGMNNNK